MCIRDRSWDDPIILSTSDSTTDSLAPAIVAEGNNVYAVWRDTVTTGTTINYDIVVKSSDNNGDTWSSQTSIASGDGTNYIPEMAYTNDRLHVTCWFESWSTIRKGIPYTLQQFIYNFRKRNNALGGLPIRIM